MKEYRYKVNALRPQSSLGSITDDPDGLDLDKGLNPTPYKKVIREKGRDVFKRFYNGYTEDPTKLLCEETREYVEGYEGAPLARISTMRWTVYPFSEEGEPLPEEPMFGPCVKVRVKYYSEDEKHEEGQERRRRIITFLIGRLRLFKGLEEAFSLLLTSLTEEKEAWIENDDQALVEAIRNYPQTWLDYPVADKFPHIEGLSTLRDLVVKHLTYEL